MNTTNSTEITPEQFQTLADAEMPCSCVCKECDLEAASNCINCRGTGKIARYPWARAWTDDAQDGQLYLRKEYRPITPTEAKGRLEEILAEGVELRVAACGWLWPHVDPHITRHPTVGSWIMEIAIQESCDACRHNFLCVVPNPGEVEGWIGKIAESRPVFGSTPTEAALNAILAREREE